MSRPDRFSRRVIELVAENRIRHAIEEGAFDHLPGEGRPIPGLDGPYDPDWWFKQWLRREATRELATPRDRREEAGAKRAALEELRAARVGDE